MKLAEGKADLNAIPAPHPVKPPAKTPTKPQKAAD